MRGMGETTRRDALKFISLMAISLSGDTSFATDGKGRSRLETGKKTETVSIGEIFAGDQLSVVVRSFSKADSLKNYQQAGPGKTYAVVRLVVKNTTQTEYVLFNSSMQTALKDESESTYQPTMAMHNSSGVGQLAPGEVARGDIMFEIPRSVTGLKLKFHSAFSFMDFKPVTVDLSSKSSSIADLEQSLRVPIHSIGKSVTHDGISVRVESVAFTRTLQQNTRAHKDQEYAIVYVKISNNSDSQVNFPLLDALWMKDGTGWLFSVYIPALDQSTRLTSQSEIPAGTHIQRKMVFEVPKGVSPLHFAFDYFPISSGPKMFWKVR